MRKVLLLIALLSWVPCLAQENTALKAANGYLVQTAATTEGYLIGSSRELQTFVTFLPKVTPYKNLPAPANPDPFLHGYSPDFENELLVIATGRDRITDPPRFQGVEIQQDGTRIVRFLLPARQTETHPYGWAVYTSVTLPRIDAETKIEVIDPEAEEKEFQRGDFKRADFERL